MKLCRDEGFSIIAIFLGIIILMFLVGLLIPLVMRIRASEEVSEAVDNLIAICEAQEAYRAKYRTYYSCKESPANGGRDKIPDSWVDEGTPGTNAFADIGFVPDKPVRYRYAVRNATETNFTATAIGDLDEDGKLSRFVVSKAYRNYPEPVRDKRGDRW